MAGSFDGSDFVGLDSDILGDGTTDATTRFLTTYTENRIDGNARYLRRRNNYVGDAPLIDRASRRIHSSYYWTALRTWVVPIDKSLKSIRALALAAIDADDRESRDGQEALLDVKLELLDFRDTEESWSGSGSLSQYDIELTDIYPTRAGYGLLILWGKATHIDTVDASSDASGVDVLGELGFFDQSATSTFLDSITADRFIRITDSDGGFSYANNAGVWDVVAKSDDNPATGTTGETILAVQPPISGNASRSLESITLSYIEPVSYALRFEYDDTVQTDGWRPKSAIEMRQHDKVLGQHTSGHQRNLTSGVYSRRRIQYLGPDGDTPSASNWPTDYKERFPLVYGNVTGTLDEGTFRLDANDQRFECRFVMASSHIVNEGFLNQDALLRNKKATAEWDLTLTVYQLTSSGWTSAASRTVTQIIDHWPSSYAGNVPILQSLYWAWYSDLGVSDDNYRMKEGHLYESDFDNPLGVLRPYSVSVDLSDVTVDITKPLRFKLTASRTATDADFGTGGGTEQQDSHLVLCMIANTGMEVPVV